jgi:hypothetical protein
LFPARKKFKISEKSEKEIILKNTKDIKYEENIDAETIQRRIEEKLESNSELSQKFANLKESFNRMSSLSKADEVEMSKRQENVSHHSQNSPPNFDQARNSFIPQSPFSESLNMPSPLKNTSTDDKSYYQLISRLLTLNNSHPQVYESPLLGMINPDTQMIVKSLVMQDLFTNAFKRLLHSSRSTIIQNINESMGMGMPSPNPVLLNALRRQSEQKRKNTDPMTVETIESDRPTQMGYLGPKEPTSRSRPQTNLSAFFPNSKSRTQSMTVAVSKHDDLNWEPKEEKKQ